MFSKRHYEFLAAFIRDRRDSRTDTWLAQDLADKLAADNPKFDRQKFLKACAKG